MTARIEVKNRKEADNLRRGLTRPDVRAFVITMGILDTLPSDRTRERVLRYVAEHFEEFPPEAPLESRWVDRN